MTDDGGGHFTDTLVILIFVYLAGIATGILGFAYWQRPAAKRKEEVEEAPFPPQLPNPISIIERVKVYKPPPMVRVGINRDCYAYHDVDNSNGRCEEMRMFRAHSRGFDGRPSKRFYPCRNCFPGGAYDSGSESRLSAEGQPGSTRHRRETDRVPLEANHYYH